VDPTKFAVIVCTPITVGVTCNLAVPETSGTAAPLFRETTVEPTVSVKLTLPVGTVAGVVVSLTVAVSVTGWPTVTGLGKALTVVWVTYGTIPAPLSGMLCVV
jgi:hypothetical protein